jgi:hypothetical protein
MLLLLQQRLQQQQRQQQLAQQVRMRHVRSAAALLQGMLRVQLAPEPLL